MKFSSQMESKHCKTDERSVWSARETELKNKPNLVTSMGVSF